MWVFFSFFFFFFLGPNSKVDRGLNQIKFSRVIVFKKHLYILIKRWGVGEKNSQKIKRMVERKVTVVKKIKGHVTIKYEIVVC